MTQAYTLIEGVKATNLLQVQKMGKKLHVFCSFCRRFDMATLKCQQRLKRCDKFGGKSVKQKYLIVRNQILK